MKMSNKTYDTLKFVLLTVIPAFILLLNTLTGIWDWNIPIKAITGTIEALALFVGICLGISSANYNKAQENEDGWSDES